LKKFMSNDDLDQLWKEPDASLFHMSRYDSQFFDRSIYNKALFARYGKPVDLEEYVLKCQMADYEATRAQYEAYSAKQNASRPATGSIYWMLNSAWPNLHWQLFDYYLSPMGAYFGTKVGNRLEHVAYDYEAKSVWLINHSLDKQGGREVSIDLIDADGKTISTRSRISRSCALFSAIPKPRKTSAGTCTGFLPKRTSSTGTIPHGTPPP
jgi:exo-1,4-beta-D-glucosaminidase